MHFITDQSSRGVLRGLIRNLAENTPTFETISASVGHAATTTRSPLKTAKVICDIISPIALHVGIVPMKKATTVKADVACFSQINDDDEWKMHIARFEVVVHVDDKRCSTIVEEYVSFSGHSLQRLFQRAGVISKESIFKEITGAVKYAKYWETAMRQGIISPTQIVVPATSGGVFVGDAIFKLGRPMLRFKTYIPAGKKRFDDVREQLVATGADAASMKTLVDNAPWLMQPYIASNG